ncbi:FadR/GntR family transcriptional regulator [Glaciibacter psychrotolerans]|uniref:GntR family transcriptional repressor for pyruvate dehydrogenase complex n=1 Tax=Glaciibacter psychrotolerans TaxID=670054 RepID=A0A7Z0J6P8_9MICO|nr:FCD domain-containing protein [Leifsonia psychrotolerans]NYJ20767.1 GntR family transcriptional repressor for pyruvate dehydrogenase complex [Leifsonia psychrotolerans]
MSLPAVVASPLIDAILRPVRGHMAFESCVEQLGSAIQLGIFEPGSKLPPERILAEKLEVSRATLREAISALRSAGLVSTTRGRGGGTVVGLVENARLPDQARNADRQEEIADVLIFRRVIEPGACYSAASSALTDAARSRLTDSLADTEKATAPADYRQADARLHLTIAALCGSGELTKSSSLIQNKVHQFLAEIPFLQMNITNSNQQHRKIVRAILDGEADTARFVMEEHCDGTAALLKGLLK